MKRLPQVLAAIVLLGGVSASASASTCRFTSALSGFVYSLSDDCRKGDELYIRASNSQLLHALALRLCDTDKAITINEPIDISHPPELRCSYLGYDRDKGQKLSGYELHVPDVPATARTNDAAPHTQATPTAPTPTAPATSSTSATSALQARKDLTAIGLGYSNQEQFMDAVRRNDKLAVELYIQGDAIDVNAKNALGETPLQAAAKLGERGSALVKLLRAAGAR